MTQKPNLVPSEFIFLCHDIHGYKETEYTNEHVYIITFIYPDKLLSLIRSAINLMLGVKGLQIDVKKLSTTDTS